MMEMAEFNFVCFLVEQMTAWETTELHSQVLSLHQAWQQSTSF